MQGRRDPDMVNDTCKKCKRKCENHCRCKGIKSIFNNPTAHVVRLKHLSLTSQVCVGTTMQTESARERKWEVGLSSVSSSSTSSASSSLPSYHHVHLYATGFNTTCRTCSDSMKSHIGFLPRICNNDQLGAWKPDEDITKT